MSITCEILGKLCDNLVSVQNSIALMPYLYKWVAEWDISPKDIIALKEENGILIESSDGRLQGESLDYLNYLLYPMRKKSECRFKTESTEEKEIQNDSSLYKYYERIAKVELNDEQEKYIIEHWEKHYGITPSELKSVFEKTAERAKEEKSLKYTLNCLKYMNAIFEARRKTTKLEAEIRSLTGYERLPEKTKSTIKKWEKDGFTEEDCKEAYRVTINNVGKFSLPYMNTVLYSHRDELNNRIAEKYGIADKYRILIETEYGECRNFTAAEERILEKWKNLKLSFEQLREAYTYANPKNRRDISERMIENMDLYISENFK